MTYQEALHYIHSNFWQGSKPGLSRTKALLNAMGNPQNELRFIHVAGTNGKGSFCAMLSSILRAAGLKVGTYTSPYILRFNERMRVDGEDIPDETLARLTEEIRPLAEAMEDKPTEFELITAIAMAYFKEENCNVVVLECGMGGRLDSTNVINTSVLSVITGIALDHTAFLGNTVKEIAAEKAGIIKPGIPVLYCGSDAEAKEVIEAKAHETGAPFLTVVRSGLTIHNQTLEGTTFTWRILNDLFLPLLGTYQTENVQNVLEAVTLLKKSGFSISDEAIKVGLAAVRWRARFEKVSLSPLIICDGGHNPQGVNSAIESVKAYFNDEKVLIVTGVMADKDYRYMVGRMAQVAKEVFCLTPNNPRALDANALADEFSTYSVSAKGYDTPLDAIKAALQKAKEENAAILCLGSLYMYQEVRTALEKLGVTLL